MDKCCGGGCGETYKSETTSEIVDMLGTLKLIEESNLLTKFELDQLFRAVITYDEDAHEKVKVE